MGNVADTTDRRHSYGKTPRRKTRPKGKSDCQSMQPARFTQALSLSPSHYLDCSCNLFNFPTSTLTSFIPFNFCSSQKRNPDALPTRTQRHSRHHSRRTCLTLVLLLSFCFPLIPFASTLELNPDNRNFNRLDQPVWSLGRPLRPFLAILAFSLLASSLRLANQRSS